jgi:hypothetical protein
MAKAVFKAEGKFYQCQSGLKPSVTTVIDTVYPNPAIANWRRKEIAAGRDPNRHAARGTELHAIAASILLGDKQPEASADAAPWVPMLREALREADPVIASEVFREGTWYAGTTDAETARGVIDIKTVSSLEYWDGKEETWLRTAPPEKRAWLQILGYLATYQEKPLEGTLIVVSPNDWIIKQQTFEERDLEIWESIGSEKLGICSDPEKGENPEGPEPFRLEWEYEAVIARRRAAANKQAKEGSAFRRFGF